MFQLPIPALAPRAGGRCQGQADAAGLAGDTVSARPPPLALAPAPSWSSLLGHRQLDRAATFGSAAPGAVSGLTLEGGPLAGVPVPASLHEAQQVAAGPRPGSADGRQLRAVALHHLHHDVQDVLLLCKGEAHASGQGGPLISGGNTAVGKRRGACLGPVPAPPQAVAWRPLDSSESTGLPLTLCSRGTSVLPSQHSEMT